jgi:putative transposase
MMRSYRFRLYPSKVQDKAMCSHLGISKNLWNEMLEHTQRMYTDYGKFPTKKALRQFVKDTGLYSQVGQELVDRLLDALKHKMQMKKKGLKGGFPRFKSFDRMKSLNYPQSGFRLGKKLKVTLFGDIAIRQHREIKGKIKTMSLKHEPSGKWFAIFTTKQEMQHNVNNGDKVGLDLGLLSFATLSDGTVIDNPRHLKKYENKLATLQRTLSKSRKGSINRRKTKHRLAVLHEKIANARKDFLHKLSNRLTSTYSLIAMEELASKEMAERQFGKSIHDAGWSMFTSMLRYKAESAGCKVMLVNPKNTTKQCSKCGTLSDKTLRDRMHNCPSCNLSMDRDLNAAKVILEKARAGTAQSNACEDKATALSMNQDACRFSGR